MSSRQSQAESKIAALKELRRELDSKLHEVPERAFIRWYCDAFFGEQKTGLFISDGVSDGGIDAHLLSNGKQYVFQMKYEKIPRLSRVGRSDIQAFDSIARLMFDGSDQEFGDWLNSVRVELKKDYQAIRNRARENRNNVEFVFVTTKTVPVQYLKETLLNIKDLSSVLPLWELYQEGFTPPTAEIELKMKQVFIVDEEKEGFSTYVGLAEVGDFREAMKEDQNDRLFAQNVRTFLKTKINDEIRRTYETEPKQFWLGNNGIYIVAKDIVSSGNTYRLIYPSIINGSQTLHSINLSQKNPECKILVRVLKFDLSNQKLLSHIITRTNSQNAMNPVNLYAHDPFQNNVARFLFPLEIFYERREREWANEKKGLLSNYERVKTKDLAQWLSVLNSDIGLGSARSNVAILFQKHYVDLFHDFDEKLTSSAYADLSCVIFSGLLFQHLQRGMDKLTRSRARITQLLFVKAFHRAIKMSFGSKSQISNALQGHAYVELARSKRLQSLIKRVVSGLVRVQREVERKDPKVDFSNFFKRQDLPERAFQKVFTSSVMSEIAKCFVDSRIT